MIRISILALIVASILAFSLFPIFQDVSLISKQVACSLFIFLLALFSFNKISVASFKVSTIAKLFLIFIAFLVPGSGLLSFDLVSINALSIWLMMFILTLVLSAQEDGTKRVLIATSTLILLIFLTIWGWFELITSMNGWFISHNSTYHVFASLGHRNLFAQFLWLLIVLTIPTFHMYPRYKQFIRGVIYLAAMLTFLILSRGAWIVAMICIASIGLHLQTSKLSLSRKHARILLATFIASLLVVAFSVDSWLGIKEHFSSAVDFSEGSMRDRFLLAKRSVIIFTENPWFGVGAGNWPAAQLAFDQSGMLSSDGAAIYLRPHNDFLWVLSENGVTAGLAYFSIFIVGLWTSIRNYFKVRSIVRLSYFLAWFVLFFSSLTNYPKERPEFLMALAALISLTVFSKNEEQPQKNWLKPIALTLISGVALVSIIYHSSAHYDLFLAESFEEKQSWNASLNKIDLAIGKGIKQDYKGFPLDYKAGQMLMQMDRINEADVRFKKALEVNQHHPCLLNVLGLLESEKGDLTNAKSYFKAAVLNTPDYSDAWLNLAELSSKEKDFEEAYEYFSNANYRTLNPLYKSLGKTLSSYFIRKLASTYNERKLWKTIEAISNTPDWSYEVLIKSKKNGFNLEYQTLMESCYYMLSHCESDSDCKKAWAIKNQYLPNQDLNLKE